MTNKILIAIFALFIGGIFVLNQVKPDEEFSELENRPLAQKPEFTVEDLVSGDYTEDLEEYVADQFVMRDEFVEIQSQTETVLGKTEINGVYIGENDILINKFAEPNLTQVENNASYIQKFQDNAPAEVFSVIFPMQNDIYGDRLPQNAPVLSEKEVIDLAYSNMDNTINVYDTLMEKNDEYIYYYTDHHWTSLGAYYAYTQIIEALGQEALPLGEKTTLTEDFNGTIFSKSGVRYAPSDAIDIYTRNFDIEIEDANGVINSTIYNYDKLESNDMYTVFLGGNDPLVRVQGDGEGKLLMIKDSYSNSLVPFLAQHFEEIHLIDLRFYKLSISDYTYFNNIDQVLIAYSVDNFSTDRNIAFLK